MALRKPKPPNPVVTHYPACSDCGAPYVLRRAMLFDASMKEIYPEFVWQRDCRHKKALPKIEQAAPRVVKKPKKKKGRTRNDVILDAVGKMGADAIELALSRPSKTSRLARPMQGFESTQDRSGRPAKYNPEKFK